MSVLSAPVALSRTSSAFAVELEQAHIRGAQGVDSIVPNMLSLEEVRAVEKGLPDPSCYDDPIQVIIAKMARGLVRGAATLHDQAGGVIEIYTRKELRRKDITVRELNEAFYPRFSRDSVVRGIAASIQSSCS